MISIAEYLKFLDSPNFDWKTIIIGFTTAQFLFENYLALRQYKVLKRTTPPATLEKEISQETFNKSQEYSRAKAKFSLFSNVINYAQSVAISKYNGLSHIWSLAGNLMVKAAPILPKFMGGVITQSIFFITTFQVIGIVLSFPLSYYHNFVLEEKYGFNKLTVRLWLTDKAKSLALSVVLGSPLIAAFLKIIDYFGDSFIFYTCAFFFIVQLGALTLYPTVIQPLFNSFTPLEDGELKTAIEDLASKNKFPLTKLYVIDGSTRSSHSNAYFTGLPWSKQIVIFDTLIETSTTEETVAVLAHEIGHWAKSHILQMMVFSQTYLFTIFALFSAFIHNRSLYQAFGFHGQMPTMIGFLLFNDILQPLDCLSSFLTNLLSRKNEYEADQYAVEQGYGQQLSVGLIKLFTNNLGSVDADWLYSAYHHSHPILAERLQAIGYVAKEKIKKEE